MTTLKTRVPATAGHGSGDQTSIDRLLHRLVAIEPGGHPVVSCYVRLGPRDRERHTYLTEVKQRIAQVSLPAARDDLERIADYLADARRLPATPGLAIFASSGRGLFEIVPLPRVHRTRVVVDDTPWIRELVAADREFGTLLTVVFDRAHGRFFSVSAFDVTELPELHQASHRGGKYHPDRRDSPGWGERDYHTRLLAERHGHLQAITHQLENLVGTHRIRGIVLAGPQKETAALARFLPAPLARLVIGRPRLNPTAVTPAEVRTAALAAAAEHAQGETAALVAALEEGLGTGWAVNELRETLRALARGQVRTLLVRDGAQREGFRCTVGQRLVATSNDCRGLGAARPVVDLIDEALEDALRERAEVVVLEGSAAAPVRDLAAFLRFR